MNNCEHCMLSEYECICVLIDRFFNTEKPKQAEEYIKPSRCLACYFSPCRCKIGDR